MRRQKILELSKVASVSGLNLPGAEPWTPGNLVSNSEGSRMIVFMEKVDPPPMASIDEEEVRKLAEILVKEDRWVKNLIDALAGILRDVRH